MCYSPSLGRWIEQDPLRYPGGATLYEYLQSRPRIALHRLGLFFGITGHYIARLGVDHDGTGVVNARPPATVPTQPSTPTTQTSTTQPTTTQPTIPPVNARPPVSQQRQTSVPGMGAR